MAHLRRVARPLRHAGSEERSAEAGDDGGVRIWVPVEKVGDSTLSIVKDVLRRDGARLR